jgi:hypothetical protein
MKMQPPPLQNPYRTLYRLHKKEEKKGTEEVLKHFSVVCHKFSGFTLQVQDPVFK